MSKSNGAQARRLDDECVERGLAPSRARAKALILAGAISVDGVVAKKAGARVHAQMVVELTRQAIPYVSRGGLKLEAALTAFSTLPGIDPQAHLALDIGASTGGFSDCLLKRGARHVICVDVGYGQLAWALRQDPRVTVLERTNARQLTPEMIAAALPDKRFGQPSFGVIDVSFISLRLVLPALARCLRAASPIIALVKPQFEAARGQVGKGGVIRDPTLRAAVIESVERWAIEHHFERLAAIDCPVHGPKGNEEYLLLLRSPDSASVHL